MTTQLTQAVKALRELHPTLGLLPALKICKSAITYLSDNNDSLDLEIDDIIEAANDVVIYDKKGVTMSNINKKALSLAHKIKPAYSSFRAALLVAYKVIKDNGYAIQVRRALVKASNRLHDLKLFSKSHACLKAFVAIYNLDYLD